jgi:hypothetical protein
LFSLSFILLFSLSPNLWKKQEFENLMLLSL